MTSTSTGVLCLYSTIIEKLDYTLPSITLPKKECGELIKMIKYEGLTHYSICLKSPLDLVHDTSNYLGLGTDELYIIQGSYQI